MLLMLADLKNSAWPLTRSGSAGMYNVLYRIAGEEGDPLQSNGVGEGLSSLRKSLIYPISFRSMGPFLLPLKR